MKAERTELIALAAASCFQEGPVSPLVAGP